MSVNIDDFEGRLFIGSNLFKYDLVALFIDIFVCYTPFHILIVDFLKNYRTTRTPWSEVELRFFLRFLLGKYNIEGVGLV